MGENKTILNANSKGQYHGYQELYNVYTITINVRVVYKNGVEIGYEEWHDATETRYYIR